MESKTRRGGLRRPSPLHVVTYAFQGTPKPHRRPLAPLNRAAAGVSLINSWWTMAQHPEPAREHGALFGLAFSPRPVSR
jgi:hypothetical protein